MLNNFFDVQNMASQLFSLFDSVPNISKCWNETKDGREEEEDDSKWFNLYSSSAILTSAAIFALIVFFIFFHRVTAKFSSPSSFKLKKLEQESAVR